MASLPVWIMLPFHVRRLDVPDPEDEGPISKFGFDLVLSTSLAPGDLVLCCVGDVVPADGWIVEGSGCLEHAARPGSMPAHPLRRVQAGARLCSGYLILRVDAHAAPAPGAVRSKQANLHGMFMRLAFDFGRRTRVHGPFI